MDKLVYIKLEQTPIWLVSSIVKLKAFSKFRELKAFSKLKFLRFENVLEIQSHKSVMFIKVTNIHCINMDCYFFPSLDAKTKLLWCQKKRQVLPHSAHSNLCNKMAMVQLTTMGQIPPSFLWRAVRLAPKKGKMEVCSTFQHQLCKGNESGE